MTRSRLVLLDANIVIQLHAMGLWAVLRAHYRLALTQAVRDESRYYTRPDGTQATIKLDADIASGEVELIEVTPRDFSRFQSRFDVGYVERLADGECESLAHITSDAAADEHLICSADAIVWRVLGCLHLRERGISLEEMLSACGRTARLPHHFTARFREEWTTRGFQEGLQGVGRKP